MKLRWKSCIIGGFVLLAGLLVSGGIWLKSSLNQPRESLEAERVLAAQAGLPFQVLIPAYLPRGLDREHVQIETGLPGPSGEAMIQLTYPARQGGTLVLSEWLPSTQDLIQSSCEAAGYGQPHVAGCRCLCSSHTQCDLSNFQVAVDNLRVQVQLSDPYLIGMQELQLILNTLGPAANQQMFSSPEDVPLSYSLPPAVEIPVNENGVQEFTLVVTPQGYSPVHFSLQKGVPARLTFRQLGQVGCGNELIFPWGSRQSAELILAAPADAQILEFTPVESGEFGFHCPHFIYQGVMVVQE